MMTTITVAKKKKTFLNDHHSIFNAWRRAIENIRQGFYLKSQFSL